VYIREAHPVDGWRSRSNDEAGIMIRQPRTRNAREKVAKRCGEALDISFPVAVDEPDDRAERAYAAFPDRLYLIDRQGRIAYKSGRGPFGYDPRGLEQALLFLLLDEKVRAF